LTFGNEWYFELFLSENLKDFAGIVTHISKNIINLQPKITKITPFSKMSTEPNKLLRVMIMKTAKILVAGANGLNGRAFLSALSNASIPARAIVRNKNRTVNLANETTEIVQADLQDTDSLKTVFEGIESAYIVTAIQPNCVQLFSNFFTAAKESGVKHVIKLSGLGAAPDSTSEILRQHYQSDQLLINSGLNYTVIQPNSFFQNIFWQKKSIRVKNRFGISMGDASQSLVDIRDVAEVTCQILKNNIHRNKVYQLTGPEALTYHDIAAHFSEKLQRPIKYRPISPSYAKQEMLAGGVPAWNANALTEIQETFANSDFSFITNDIKKILGKIPKSFPEFLEDYKVAFN
jgi:uncharacterized protein YbjT (DUF2867 family)